ncbi:hypothetical protein HK099_000373, partial [Clydaea vesicula]
RVLKIALQSDDNNENACLDFCKANFLGRPYAATNGDNCFCLSYKEYIDVEKGDKSKCNIKCKKKDSEFCGGNDAHSISPVCSCYKNVDDSRAGGRLILTDDKNMSIERCINACYNYSNVIRHFAIVGGK